MEERQGYIPISIDIRIDICELPVSVWAHLIACTYSDIWSLEYDEDILVVEMVTVFISLASECQGCNVFSVEPAMI